MQGRESHGESSQAIGKVDWVLLLAVGHAAMDVSGGSVSSVQLWVAGVVRSHSAPVDRKTRIVLRIRAEEAG